MTDEQIVAVVQAEIDGKAIEMRQRGTSEVWGKKSGKGAWHFKYFDYRIADSQPTPREVFGLEIQGRIGPLFASVSQARDAMNVTLEAKRLVCFREVVGGE